MLTKRFYAVSALTLGVALTLAMTGCPTVGVLEDGLVIIDDVPEIEVTAVTADSVALGVGSRAAAPLQAGDIIVGSAQGGFLRRVDAVSESRGSTIVKTSDASLNEVVREGLIYQGINFDGEAFARAGVVAKNAKGTLIDISGMDIYRDNGIRVSVANGTLESSPSVHLAASWKNWELQGFRLHAAGDVRLNMDVKIGVDNGTPLQFETNLIPPVVQPFATAIGPIPVVGRATLRFPIGVIGTFDGDVSMTAGFDVVDSFDIGASYEFEEWTRTFNLANPVFTGHEPVWVVEIGANAKVYVKVVAELSLYDSAEMAGYLMPYLNANYHAFPGPMTFVLTGGLDAGFSYGVSIFDFNIVGDSYHWAGPSAELYSWSSAN
jgi:hypothetical protein